MKDILLSVLKVLIPIGFGYIIRNNPDFPLNEEQFVTTALYIIGGILGGWEAVKYRLKFATGKTYKQILGK